MVRQPKVGDVVVFTDPTGRETSGLLTNTFGPMCANVVYLSLDESRSDNYGRQTERASSCQRMTKDRPVQGNSWHYPEEKQSGFPTAHDLLPQQYPAT